MSEIATEFTDRQIAQAIDHALLKPDMTRDEVFRGCELANRYNVFSVCVRPWDIEAVSAFLCDSPVLVGTVIGFPHGTHTSATKGFEARDAVRHGADELDMVVNIAALKSRNYELVLHDIESVVREAEGRIVKVILETSYLTDGEIEVACRIVGESGAQFVKTSTGFASGGATLEHVRLMRASSPEHVQVKASGGIRTREAAVSMLKAGASRLGTTGTEAILGGEQPGVGSY